MDEPFFRFAGLLGSYRPVLSAVLCLLPFQSEAWKKEKTVGLVAVRRAVRSVGGAVIFVPHLIDFCQTAARSGHSQRTGRDGVSKKNVFSQSREVFSFHLLLSSKTFSLLSFYLFFPCLLSTVFLSSHNIRCREKALLLLGVWRR